MKNTSKKSIKQDSRKQPAPGYDEKQPNRQFPSHTKAPIPKKPKK